MLLGSTLLTEALQNFASQRDASLRDVGVEATQMKILLYGINFAPELAGISNPP